MATKSLKVIHYFIRSMTAELCNHKVLISQLSLWYIQQWCRNFLGNFISHYLLYTTPQTHHSCVQLSRHFRKKTLTTNSVIDVSFHLLCIIFQNHFENMKGLKIILNCEWSHKMYVLWHDPWILEHATMSIDYVRLQSSEQMDKMDGRKQRWVLGRLLIG